MLGTTLFMAFLLAWGVKADDRKVTKSPVCGWGVGAFGTTHCGICQTELVEGDSLRILPCAHIFHARCLIDMVAIGRTAVCPECRRTFGTIAPLDPEVPVATG
ncbi:hypothetical protein SLA2020_440960 [Shorea laevis]